MLYEIETLGSRYSPFSSIRPVVIIVICYLTVLAMLFWLYKTWFSDNIDLSKDKELMIALFGSITVFFVFIIPLLRSFHKDSKDADKIYRDRLWYIFHLAKMMAHTMHTIDVHCIKKPSVSPDHQIIRTQPIINRLDLKISLVDILSIYKNKSCYAGTSWPPEDIAFSIFETYGMKYSTFYYICYLAIEYRLYLRNSEEGPDKKYISGSIGKFELLLEICDDLYGRGYLGRRKHIYYDSIYDRISDDVDTILGFMGSFFPEDFETEYRSEYIKNEFSYFPELHVISDI